MPARTVGPLVRDWRTLRRRSQMDLALEVGVSPRHLSFVETGRSRPSPELLMAVAHHLDVPLRERNTLLLAAGYAPRYPQTAIDDASMTRIRNVLQRLLEAHEPYPGVVIDRAWNIVLANAAARHLLAG
jgi:transcriptional regulator with XRE-family HTH domain